MKQLKSKITYETENYRARCAIANNTMPRRLLLIQSFLRFQIQDH
jgi:hypothetical protein